MKLDVWFALKDMINVDLWPFPTCSRSVDVFWKLILCNIQITKWTVLWNSVQCTKHMIIHWIIHSVTMHVFKQIWFVHVSFPREVIHKNSLMSAKYNKIKLTFLPLHSSHTCRSFYESNLDFLLRPKSNHTNFYLNESYLNR